MTIHEEYKNYKFVAPLSMGKLWNFPNVRESNSKLTYIFLS